MKRHYLLFILCLLSCLKEKSKESIPVTCEYAPYTMGSTFDYQYTTDTHDTVLYTLTVTGDTLIYGNPFSILSDGINHQYIRCDHGRYYLFEAGISTPAYVRPDGLRLFLYDTKSTGDSWSDTVNATVSGELQRGLLQYTILQTNVTRTVAGNKYAHVIAIKQNAALIIEGKVYPWGDIATYYYAQNIGYIEAQGVGYTISLRSYNVK